MNKIKWMNSVKQSSLKHSFQRLEILKEKHSKVSNIKYGHFRMQKYLSPNDENLSKSEMQTIFKMRCKVMNVKMNMKSMHESHECRVCLKEKETQEHVFRCKEIFEYRKSMNMVETNYDKIEYGSVKEQKEVMKTFKEQLKALEFYVEKEKHCN